MTPVPVEAGKNTKSVTVVREPFVIPGFRVSVVASGMRYSGRPDLALIVADEEDGAAAAGVFTMNEFCAAPVIVCEEHLRSSLEPRRFSSTPALPMPARAKPG